MPVRVDGAHRKQTKTTTTIKIFMLAQDFPLLFALFACEVFDSYEMFGNHSLENNSKYFDDIIFREDRKQSLLSKLMQNMLNLLPFGD